MSLIYLFEELICEIDGRRALKITDELTTLELGQTTRDWQNAASYAHKALQEAGADNAEIQFFPADGKTVYMDKRMPLAWEASIGKLTVIEGNGYQSGEVLADYSIHPFHLVNGSVSTPEGGQDIRIITEEQFLNGADATGALVLTGPETWPWAAILTPVLDRGGIGLVSDFLKGGDRTPDCIQWVAAETEGAHWHVQCEDRPFISFSISPASGRRVRAAASKAPFLVHIESNGRRFESVLPCVTGTITGERKEEVWLTAHLYEPMADDNSSGVAAVLETIRSILRRGKPKFTIRAVFTMELYGYAAYCASRGPALREEVIGGCNYDAAYYDDIILVEAGPAVPYFGNLILEQLYQELRDIPIPRLTLRRNGAYFDDISISDPTVGVPSVWPLENNFPFWHNSVQTADRMRKDLFVRCIAVHALWALSMAFPDESLVLRAEERVRADLEEEAAKQIPVPPGGSAAERFHHCAEILLRHFGAVRRILPGLDAEPALARLRRLAEQLESKLPSAASEPNRWPAVWKEASRIRPKRQEPGFPCDLVKIPLRKRIPLPDRVIYGPFSNLLANMNGIFDLAALLRFAGYETGQCFSEEKTAEYVKAIEYLIRYSYIFDMNGVSSHHTREEVSYVSATNAGQ